MEKGEEETAYLECRIGRCKNGNILQAIDRGHKIRLRQRTRQRRQLAINSAGTRAQRYREHRINDMHYAATEHHIRRRDGGLLFQSREDLHGLARKYTHDDLAAGHVGKTRVGEEGRDELRGGGESGGWHAAV